MLKAIRVAILRHRYNRANADYLAYQAQPSGRGWSQVIAKALLVRLLNAERALSYAING